MKKETLVFDVGSLKNWIGGVYYIKNIIFCLLQSESLRSKYKIFVFVGNEYRDIFEVFDSRIDMYIYQTSIIPKRHKEFKNKIKDIECKYIYNYQISSYGIRKIKKGIFWIADFQHKHFPEYFTKKELFVRNIKYKILSQLNINLVLSSREALRDFNKYYTPYKAKVHVIHFVSYIEEELKKITPELENKILRQYSLNKYVYIPNQFWQHKNHIVVLKAIEKIFKNNELKEFKFVFTGELSDYRNPEYIKKIGKLMGEDIFLERVLNLGFVKREEQLVIMKNAELIIQPSLFEGWGTVLEDAKVLDKKILLSDIPVHREQMNENCFLFNPYDPEELRLLITRAVKKRQGNDLEKGLKNMYQDAREYVKELENILL